MKKKQKEESKAMTKSMLLILSKPRATTYLLCLRSQWEVKGKLHKNFHHSLDLSTADHGTYTEKDHEEKEPHGKI